MDDKKTILKLYDMIRDCRKSIEHIESSLIKGYRNIAHNQSYHFDSIDSRGRELKELGFNKEEVKEILDLDSGFIKGLQILNEVFKEYE